MCRYVQQEHTVCGCITHHPIERCFEARINGIDCPVDWRSKFLTLVTSWSTLCEFHAEDKAEEDLVKAGFCFANAGRKIKIVRMQREREARLEAIRVEREEREKMEKKERKRAARAAREKRRERMTMMELD